MEDVCDICGKPLGDDVWHVEDVVGHSDCLYKAVNRGMRELQKGV